jgi:hypothetical protein
MYVIVVTDRGKAPENEHTVFTTLLVHAIGMLMNNNQDERKIKTQDKKAVVGFLS